MPLKDGQDAKVHATARSLVGAFSLCLSHTPGTKSRTSQTELISCWTLYHNTCFSVSFPILYRTTLLICQFTTLFIQLQGHSSHYTTDVQSIIHASKAVTTQFESYHSRMSHSEIVKRVEAIAAAQVVNSLQLHRERPSYLRNASPQKLSHIKEGYHLLSGIFLAGYRRRVQALQWLNMLR